MSTTRQIEIFVKTAQLGSVRLAAEALGISQPSVSKQIRALERHTGGDLFTREPGKSLRLSQLGREILVNAEQTLHLQQSMREIVEDRHARIEANIYVRAVMRNFVETRFSEICANGLPEDADFILVDDRDDIYARVAADRKGLSLLRSVNMGRSEKLQKRILRSERACLYASPELSKRIEKGEISPREVVFFSDSHRIEATNFGGVLLQSAGFHEAITMRAPQFIEQKMNKVLRGEGIGVFLEWHAREHVQKGQLKSLSTSHEQVHFLLIAHPLFDPLAFNKLADVFASVISE